jgi:hypothetical protein
MKNLTCTYCGIKFTAERVSAKYCSASCKSMANRLRRREETNELIRLKLEDDRITHQQTLLNLEKQQFEEIQKITEAERQVSARKKDEKLEVSRQKKAKQDAEKNQKRELNRIRENTQMAQIEKSIENFFDRLASQFNNGSQNSTI